MSKQPSKRYRAALQVADLKAKYDVNQAAEIIKKMPGAKFDETVEISAFLGVDPKQSDQMVRGTVSLPNGSGKKIKVLAFTENPAEALAAGADYAGLADLIAKVNGGFLDFDAGMAGDHHRHIVLLAQLELGDRHARRQRELREVDDVAQGQPALRLFLPDEKNLVH